MKATIEYNLCVENVKIHISEIECGQWFMANNAKGVQTLYFKPSGVRSFHLLSVEEGHVSAVEGRDYLLNYKPVKVTLIVDELDRLVRNPKKEIK